MARLTRAPHYANTAACGEAYTGASLLNTRNAPARLRARLARYFGAHHAPVRAIAAAVIGLVFVLGFIIVATGARNPDLSHVKVAFLSGSEEGNYHAIIARVA